MSTKTNMPKFSYENVINHYLAEGPIPADKWDQPDRNATKTETSETNTMKDANDHQVIDPQSESRLALIEVLGTPTPGTEDSVKMKLSKRENPCIYIFDVVAAPINDKGAKNVVKRQIQIIKSRLRSNKKQQDKNSH